MDEYLEGVEENDFYRELGILYFVNRIFKKEIITLRAANRQLEATLAQEREMREVESRQEREDDDTTDAADRSSTS